MGAHPRLETNDSSLNYEWAGRETTEMLRKNLKPQLHDLCYFGDAYDLTVWHHVLQCHPVVFKTDVRSDR